MLSVITGTGRLAACSAGWLVSQRRHVEVYNGGHRSLPSLPAVNIHSAVDCHSSRVATDLFNHAGFHGEGRSLVRDAATAAGATYSGDLQKGVTTHLVVSDDAGTAASAKLQCAAEWGIPALQWAWLKQSALRHSLLPHGLYMYSGTEGSSRDDAKRQRTPLQDATAAAPSSAAQPLAAVQPGSLPTAQASRCTLKRADGAAGSKAAVIAESVSQRHPHAGQENRLPRSVLSSTAASPCSRDRTADCTEALAAKLEGMQVLSSPLSRSALVSMEHTSSTTLMAEDPREAAAASRASSRTCSVASDDDGIECSQRLPGVVRSSRQHGRNRFSACNTVQRYIHTKLLAALPWHAESGDAGDPLTLPSPAQQRHGSAGVLQDARELASPQPSMSAAAAAAPDTITTGCTEAPATLTSMPQVSHADACASPTRPRAHMVLSWQACEGPGRSIWPCCSAAVHSRAAHHSLDNLQDLCSSPPACAVRRAGPLPLAGGATPGHRAGDGGAIVALKVRLKALPLLHWFMPHGFARPQHLLHTSTGTSAHRKAACRAGDQLCVSPQTAIECRCWRGRRAATLCATITTSIASSWHACSLQSLCRWASGRHSGAH
jgi:twin BRCT domain